MPLKHSITLFFFLLCFSSFSQGVKIDSLVQLVSETKSDTTKINSLNELSWQHINTGNYELALNFANQAIDYSKEIIHSSALPKPIALAIKNNLGKSYNYLGIIYKYQGDYDKALEFYFKSLKIKEETSDKNGMAASYNNIGTIYTSKSYYDKALEFYFKSLAIFEELNDKNGMAASYNNIGNNHYLKKDYDKALEFYSKSLKIREERGDKKGMAKSYNNFGLIYSVRKEYDKSLEYYFKALAIRTSINDKNGMTSSHRNIGDVYLFQKKPTEAKKHLLQALSIATEISAKPLLIDTYQSLSRCDSSLGDYKGAFQYYRLYSTTKDAVFNEESDKSLTEMQTKYESQKKEKEIALLSKEKEKQAGIAAAESKRQRQILFFISGILALVVIFSFFMYRGNLQKKKANKIISAQKIEVEKQRDLIGIKNKDITDSLNYAKRIQTAILPSEENIQKHLSELFIIYQPKDIVAGDFYWMEVKGDLILLAAADCTGHGVPGAMVSVVCSNALNRTVKEFGITEPGKILDKVRELVIETFVRKDSYGEKSESEVKDGMDISLCSINKNTYELRWAGANNPLWYFHNHELKEINADKQPIGKTDNPLPFTTNSIQMNKGEQVYLFTDGYADQFGGEKGKKFKYKQLQQLLSDNKEKSMPEQKIILDETIEKWKGNLEQVDDILVIGIRL